MNEAVTKFEKETEAVTKFVEEAKGQQQNLLRKQGDSNKNCGGRKSSKKFEEEAMRQ